MKSQIQKAMSSSEIRSRFLKFFEKRGHAIIPSASLVTPDEKGVANATLFNIAGMQPLMPFLLGKPHPMGKRLVDSQKCFRTVDIDDIGDKTHATFFEMLGNWSLGDYFKEQAIKWSYEFLTDKEEGLGLDPKRLYITVFEGDENAPKDEEALKIWKKIFDENDIKGERIFFMPASSNWWEAGDNGPCGPDSEMYYDVSDKFKGKGLTKEEFLSADSERSVVEVWNDVFMQYEKKDGKIVGRLPKPSIDTGAGLERLAIVMQGVDNIYDTDLLKDIFEKSSNFSDNIKSRRIISDHIRASVFLINDGVTPSNTDRGYILRRLIRRAVFNTNKKFLEEKEVGELVDSIVSKYKDAYKDLLDNLHKIKDEIYKESVRFSKTLESGVKEFNKINGKEISGKQAFSLFSSYGLPIDMTILLAKEKGMSVDMALFEEEFKRHQDLSRIGAEKKFKGGLADTDEMSVRYHTATHLLHQALFDVLGPEVAQKGSNITKERLRFDFSFGRKMTDEEKKEVEKIVNEKIAQALPVNKVILNKEQAEKTGARHLFGEKYSDSVSIYFIGNDLETAYSKEFCGGPHVKNTRELAGEDGSSKFVILKEEAISQGVRRIKAVLQ